MKEAKAKKAKRPKKCPVCQTFVSVFEGYEKHEAWMGTVHTYVHKRMDGRMGCGLCGAVWPERKNVHWPIRISLVDRSTRGKMEIGYCEETGVRVLGRRFGIGIGWFRLRILVGRGWG